MANGMDSTPTVRPYPIKRVAFVSTLITIIFVGVQASRAGKDNIQAISNGVAAGVCGLVAWIAYYVVSRRPSGIITIGLVGVGSHMAESDQTLFNLAFPRLVAWIPFFVCMGLFDRLVSRSRRRRVAPVLGSEPQGGMKPGE